MPTKSFAASSANLTNPERGFFIQDTDAAGGGLPDARRSEMTLVRSIFRLDAYRNTDQLPPELLARVETSLKEAETKRIKLIPRFSYNFGDGGDAPLERVLKHVAQLAPLLTKYAHVIAWVEVGFAGRWAELHSSTTGLLDGHHGFGANMKKVVLALLRGTPQSMFFNVRYGSQHKQLDGDAMFSDADMARIGFTNDYLLGDGEGVGAGYHWTTVVDGKTITVGPEGGLYEYQNNSAMWDYCRAVVSNGRVPMGGEPDPRAVNSRRTGNAVLEMKAQGWTAARRKESFDSGTWAQVQSKGLYDEIGRRLGYRLQLESITLPDTIAAGSTVEVKMTWINHGFASPIHERPVQLVLAGVRCALQGFSVRSLKPGRHSVTATFVAPGLSGHASVGLALPDASPKIAALPEYAIRLANDGMSWVDGINDLGMQVAFGGATSPTQPPVQPPTQPEQPPTPPEEPVVSGGLPDLVVTKVQNRNIHGGSDSQIRDDPQTGEMVYEYRDGQFYVRSMYDLSSGPNGDMREGETVWVGMIGLHYDRALPNFVRALALDGWNQAGESAGKRNSIVAAVFIDGKLTFSHREYNEKVYWSATVSKQPNVQVPFDLAVRVTLGKTDGKALSELYLRTTSGEGPWQLVASSTQANYNDFGPLHRVRYPTSFSSGSVVARLKQFFRSAKKLPGETTQAPTTPTTPTQPPSEAHEWAVGDKAVIAEGNEAGALVTVTHIDGIYVRRADGSGRWIDSHWLKPAPTS